MQPKNPSSLSALWRWGIELSFAKRSFVLEGQVVHCVPRELAAAGAGAGVALQLTRMVSELRELFAEFIHEEEPAPRPAAKTGADRRDSPREAARVHVRVCGRDGIQLEGLTRNLSRSGILFSLSGDPLPVQEEVEVWLSEPGSGREVKIPSVVARHVEGKGRRVTALGIRFAPPDEHRAEIQDFLSALERSEHSRRLGGISGAIAELGLANLLQTLSLSAPKGTRSHRASPPKPESVTHEPQESGVDQ